MTTITLHPEFGVNPTMGVCFWCQEEDGTIGLLGANRGKEAPRRTVLSMEPCTKCKSNMALGITLIEATESKQKGFYGQPVRDPYTRIMEEHAPFFSGRWLVVTPGAVMRIFTPIEVAQDVLRHRKAYMLPDAFQQLCDKIKESKNAPEPKGTAPDG